MLLLDVFFFVKIHAVLERILLLNAFFKNIITCDSFCEYIYRIVCCIQMSTHTYTHAHKHTLACEINRNEVFCLMVNRSAMKGVHDQMYTKLYTMFFFVHEMAATAGLLTTSSARERSSASIGTYN